MMKFISRIWFPAVLVSAVTLQMGIFHRDVETDDEMIMAYVESPDPLMDTVIYPRAGYKKLWTPEERTGTVKIADSLLQDGGEEFADEEAINTRPDALDTLIPPDSLLQIDTFFYKYYAAIKDSLCHRYVRDSLIAAGDSLDWPRIDSLYLADSTATAKAAYWAWYNGLDKKERRKADFERLMPIKQAQLDSIRTAKDSIQAVKDSTIENTPRILETYVLKDSMLYKRMIRWKHDREFHNITILPEDTSYNYRFYDYPFMREDVNASWLGVAGSPVQYYDYSKRGAKEDVSFYEVQESWSYSPSTLPCYNTKTPYTELSYFGTLLAGQSKESDNLHLLTTQNITPSLNILMFYDRFGGSGMLANEETKNKTAVVAANYLGKKYLMHSGYIYNMVSRKENGGINDNFWIRDTTVDAREIKVNLSDARSMIKKNTVFVDQQYRIPFYFLEKWFHGKDTLSVDTLALAELPPPAEEDPENAPSMEGEEGEGSEEPSDTLKIDDSKITTAFIGHSSELSVYRRVYQDKVTDTFGKDFFGNVFNYNPTSSYDSLRVMKLENKVFIRLQPWSDEGIVSKLDVGLGNSLRNYYTPDPAGLGRAGNHKWSATYLYGGVRGMFKNYVDWDAYGRYVFLGDEINDFELKANATLNIYPFRRARTSPMTFDAHFSTTLDEPEYYVQHMYSNHFRWDNEFGKISKTSISGGMSIPRWKLGLNVAYNLLANNIYYGTDALPYQNGTAMSILSASLYKNFRAGKLHFDHKLLFQVSSNEEVIPLPKLAANARYYVQLSVGPTKALDIQLGANVWYNTAWYAPSWNPVIGNFHNQTDIKYGNAPYADLFANLQWKRACIFIKWENANMGWPLEEADYFSANHYIRTQRVVKFGMYWPFYTQPGKAHGESDSHGHSD